MRGQKGITLVALIITIIVLLILAVVTIGAVKDSSIVNHAENAADKYNSAKVTENSSIYSSENKLNYLVTSTDNQ